VVRQYSLATSDVAGLWSAEPGAGQWTVESIYGTPGYSDETFLVVTTNAEAAAMLSDQHARKYGLHDLPPGTERLGTAIVVTRE